MITSAVRAHTLTWKSSKQTYLTALLLADRGKVNDCMRAYAYLRWVDDRVDRELQEDIARTAFIARQKTLIAALYRCEAGPDLCQEERMAGDLILHDRRLDTDLYSFLTNFMTVIEFDSDRRGRLVREIELEAYTSCLATAVMDGMQYFIGGGQSYPETPDRILAVTGAHIVHMLRDMLEDLQAGIVNVPLEAIRDRGIFLEDRDSEAFRGWVRQRTNTARQALDGGRKYINSLDCLRCRLAGTWYLARFESVLKTIEREAFQLKERYPERHSLAAWIRMVQLGFKVGSEHFAARLREGRIPGRRSLALQSSRGLHPDTMRE